MTLGGSLVVKRLHKRKRLDEQVEFHRYDQRAFRRFCNHQQSASNEDLATLRIFGICIGSDAAKAVLEATRGRLQRCGYLAGCNQITYAAMVPASHQHILKHLMHLKFVRPASGARFESLASGLAARAMSGIWVAE